MAVGRGLRFTITASDRSKAAFGGVQNNLRKTQGLQRSWNAGLNSNRRAVQQFGFQMSDFAIQIAGGQSAMLAFTQQGGQMLQFFGPAGAISAAFLAVFGSLAIAFTRSGKALSDLTPILGVLKDDFAAIGRGLGVVKEVMIDFANIIVNNMDRILITTATVAGFFAGKWVVAFVAARIATASLAGSLLWLRAAMIRTGFLALIVGAGELVYQFTRLVKGAGGFGNALALLKDLAVEVFQRIGEAFGTVPLAIKAGSAKMHSFFMTKLTDMAISFAKFTQNVAQGMNELFGTNLSGISVMTGFVGDMQDADIEIAQSARDAAAAVAEAWGGLSRPLESIQAIREAMANVDEQGRDIDIRDWFGGGSDDEDGGGRSRTDRISDEARKIKGIFDDLSSSISTSLSTAFNGIIDKTKSLKDVANNMLQSIFNKLTDTIMSPLWDAIGQKMASYLIGVPGATGSFGGGVLSNLLNGMLSFAGGGHTGNGPRSGGLDGRGGKLAMVHPNETVMDHTRGQSVAGGSMSLQVHIHENASEGETRVEQNDGRVDVFLRKAVNDVIGGGGADRSMKQRYGIRAQAAGG